MTATRAGLEVLSSFRLSLRIEEMVVRNLEEICSDEEIRGERELQDRKGTVEADEHGNREETGKAEEAEGTEAAGDAAMGEVKRAAAGTGRNEEGTGSGGRPRRGIATETFRRAFALVPMRDAEKMMDHLRRLTRLGMQRGTIAATQEVLSEIQKSISSKDEKEALSYALWVLDRLDAQVQAHSRELMERLLRIAELTERRYLEEIHGQE